MQRYEYGDARRAIAMCGDDASRVISFFIFDTEVHLHAYASGDESAQDPDAIGRLDAALAACRDRCLYFEHHLSRTRPESDIGRAHACAPAEVRIAPETADLIRRSLGYCERSRGTFDVTMGTVTRLWDFHEGVAPSLLALSRALPHLGCSHIHLGGTAGEPTLSIDDPETVLDLGGVAKGYVADDLAGILVGHGVDRFVINLGGNVLVRGGRPRDDAARPPVRPGAPWKIGIVNPRDPAHYRAIVDVSDGSIVTSGLHERRFTRGGRTYHHILSPQDGMPVRTDVASATIIAPASIDCDGYSTAALMLGMDEGLAFVEGIDGVEGVFISDADEVRWTSGVADELSLVPTLPRW